MEITIKIELNDENMKNFADIFWAPVLKPRAIQNSEFRPKEVDINRAAKILLYTVHNGGTEPEVRRALSHLLAVTDPRTSLSSMLLSERDNNIRELQNKYRPKAKPTAEKTEETPAVPIDLEPKAVAKPDPPKPTRYPTKPIKEWSEFATMLNRRVADSPLSIPEIAVKLRVNPTSVFNWKEGRNVPSIPSLSRLCHLFDWDREYMLKLREEAVSK